MDPAMVKSFVGVFSTETVRAVAALVNNGAMPS